MARREKWNGSPVKPGNWGTWAQIEYGRRTKQSCYTCLHCHDELSCNKTGAVIAEIGKGFFRQCEYYQLSDEYFDLAADNVQVSAPNSSMRARVNEEHIGKYNSRAEKNTNATEMRRKRHSNETHSSIHVVVGTERSKRNLRFVGLTVEHKIYGQGRITRAVDGRIVVDFSTKKEVAFLAPMCFDRGFLKLI